MSESRAGRLANGVPAAGACQSRAHAQRARDQTLGGLSKSGIRALAVTSEDRGRTRKARGSKTNRASTIIVGMVWKHLARHAPAEGHPFAGQFGHDLAGLCFAGLCFAGLCLATPWQGISLPDDVASWVAAGIATACVEVTGPTISPASMATMPSKTNQRWKWRRLKSRYFPSPHYRRIVAGSVLLASVFRVIRMKKTELRSIAHTRLKLKHKDN